MLKLGLGLMQYEYHVDWPALAALRPHALLLMDAGHYPAAQLAVGPGGLVIWRPTEPAKPLWQHFATGAAWADYIIAAWPHDNGRPHLVQWVNEPNLRVEWDYPDGDLAGAAHLRAWGASCVARLRAGWPQVGVLSPPVSPMAYGNDLAYLEALAPLVQQCHVFNAHCYWATPAGLYDPQYREQEAYRYRLYRQMFPELPFLVTECNRPHHGVAAYGAELYHYATTLDPYVQAALHFVWSCFPGVFAEYVLEGTPAYTRLADLVAADPPGAGCACPACGTALRLEVA